MTAGPTHQALVVTSQVIADQTASRQQSQYRLRMANEDSGESASVNFSGPASFVPPELVITYRTR